MVTNFVLDWKLCRSSKQHLGIKELQKNGCGLHFDPSLMERRHFGWWTATSTAKKTLFHLMMDQDDVVHRTRTVNPKKLYKERESQREGGRYVPLSHFNILSQSRNIISHVHLNEFKIFKRYAFLLVKRMNDIHGFLFQKLFTVRRNPEIGSHIAREGQFRARNSRRFLY